ncbi:hypothetical protein KR222_001386 [Zaprionus bogoriensis]|nr:hypothetical protein KR222_001386 [Zaprionus bogoriensis]
MNQNQIQQLTSHLSQALDQNYDVVNMEAVLSVICALEGTSITKEQLEATRLAKYINQLRRRTTNESLARRAKSLLKKWREMVGIQPTTSDSQQLPPPQLQSQALKKTIVEGISAAESAITETVVNTVQPVLPAASDSLEPTNFTNLIRHINIGSSIDHVAKSIRSQPTVDSKPGQFINDRSSNSACNMEKLSGSSVVIDIVTDSDDNNDHDNDQSDQFSKFPSLFPKNKKKIKKDKKQRDRDARVNPSFLQQQQQSKFNKILSSNSSMSSILSVEATSGNSQSQGKFRVANTTPDLTFAGRFKSAINRLDNSMLPDSQKQAANVDKPIFAEAVNNDDSSTSCSRLSMFEDLDFKEQSVSAIKAFEKTVDNEKSLSQVPKKRGRKKGSKGVDSIIANRESSLSQQIFFGSGAGVKKVKTTKELFNEIQNRAKTAVNHGDTLIGARISAYSNAETRPASSCSETSINSPQTLGTYASTKTTHDDCVNTDSDTISSERQTSLSLDSNSNNSLLPNASKKIASETNYNADNVKTQLMHLVHSFNSPLSITDTERLYEAQLVPCTCRIIEEMKEVHEINVSSAADTPQITANSVDFDRESAELVTQKKKIDNLNTSKNSPDATAVILPIKPVKSIFDLDFDDDEDPLNLIVNDFKLSKSVDYSKLSTKNDFKSGSGFGLTSEPINCLDVQEEEKQAESDIQVELTSSIYTLLEDPNCPAKQRFNVQTMDVTGFHINALHNYYVPNINGNWNSKISLSKPYPKLAEFVAALDSYTVSDGDDVVPKYGSLTYQRIRKDLSSLEIGKKRRSKICQSSVAPFLGIAKCLPSCRRVAKKQSEPSDFAHSVFEDNSSSISVDVQNVEDLKSSELLYSNDEDTYENSNLLQLAGYETEIVDTMSRQRAGNTSNRYSNFSFNTNTDNSMHGSFSNQRHAERNLVERNRKKRRKILKGQDSRIKRIKIAINGDVAPQRHSSDIDNDIGYRDNDTKYHHNAKMQNELRDTEHTESGRSRSTVENDQGNDIVEFEEKYAIVRKPLTSGDSKNHIVLTIKKTPSKVSSPIASEVVYSTVPIKTKHSRTKIQNNLIEASNEPIDCVIGLPRDNNCIKNLHGYCRYRCRHYRDQKSSCQQETIDSELKHFFRNKNNINLDPRSILKTHHKLFFMNELNRIDNEGHRKRIINYSSSDESECELEIKFRSEQKSISLSEEQNRDNLKVKYKIETEPNALKININQESYLYSSNESVNNCGSDVSCTHAKLDDLQLNDNGMLPSFNSISSNSDDNASIRFYNPNINATKSYNFNPSSSAERTLEYRSGIRTVAQDDSQIQQFREWHEVVQLQSYNSEPLIVLPYVVLE